MSGGDAEGAAGELAREAGDGAYRGGHIGGCIDMRSVARYVACTRYVACKVKVVCESKAKTTFLTVDLGRGSYGANRSLAVATEVAFS